MSERFKELRKLREKYISLLGDTFHRVGAEVLAQASLEDPEKREIIEDYVNHCFPEFKTLYKNEIAKQSAKKSQLEVLSQSLPKGTEPLTPEDPTQYREGPHGPARIPPLREGPCKRYVNKSQSQPKRTTGRLKRSENDSDLDKDESFPEYPRS